MAESSGGCHVVLRMIIGLGLTAIAFAVAGRRLWWLLDEPTAGLDPLMGLQCLADRDIVGHVVFRP
jgi:ABC-type transport system involved in cytochrome bd biosynthesis fused ATPase/permease subunit